MNNCFLKNNHLYVLANEYEIDSLLSLDFYSFSNKIVDRYYTGEVFDNILFEVNVVAV